jgi:hypothetical protein
MIGFVYGHFDSRGGTTFICEEDRKKADQKYFDLFELSQEEIDQFGSKLIEEDFFGPADLDIDGLDIDLRDHLDLENHGVVVVLNPGEKSWQTFTGDRFKLKFIRTTDVGELTQPVPDGGVVGEWSDDAYGFVIIT